MVVNVVWLGSTAVTSLTRRRSSVRFHCVEFARSGVFSPVLRLPPQSKAVSGVGLVA